MKFLFWVLVFLFFLGDGFSQNLDGVEINYINDCKKINIEKNKNVELDSVINLMEELEPNYLTEVLYRLPVEGNEDLLELVESFFFDLELFKQIPYYSRWKRQSTFLFSKAELLSSNKIGDATLNKVVFCMTPFSDYQAEIKMVKKEESFVFQHVSLEKMDYKGLVSIKKGAMRAGIAVYKDGDFWQIYGLGGVKAPKPFFLKRLLEDAFNERIQNFCIFYIEKINSWDGKKLKP